MQDKQPADFSQNYLVLNKNKTHSIVFSLKIEVNISHVKLLGINIDSRLTWSPPPYIKLLCVSVEGYPVVVYLLRSIKTYVTGVL